MRLDYGIDGGSATRACLALIVLHVDETVETEFRRLTDLDGVAVYYTRVESGTDLTEETIAAVARRIPDAARLLPPRTIFDAVGYACTSGATVIGPANVARIIRDVRPTASPAPFTRTAITDPITAVKAACRALHIRRLAVVTPYIPSVTSAIVVSLEADGLTIPALGSFHQPDEHTVSRISPASVERAILTVGRSAPCDGVFVSCTNLRTLDVLPGCEATLGRPVLSSTQALAWHMLRAAGISNRVKGFGTLFDI